MSGSITEKRKVETIDAPLREQFHVRSSTSSDTPQDATVSMNTDKKIKARKKRKKFFVQRVSASQRMLLLDNLSTMLTAGLSIVDAMIILSSEIKNKQLKRSILEIKAHVESGQPFSDSLGSYPEIFPEIFVASIRVGEASGTLSEVLSSLADMSRRETQLKRKVIGALMYPSVVLIAMIVVGIIMLTYVFPQIISIFEESNINLPIQIRFMDRLGEILQLYGFWILLAIILGIVILMSLMKIRNVKKFIGKQTLKIPLIGTKIVQGSILARMMSNLETMLTSGMSIVKGMSIVSKTTNNLEYRDELIAIAKEIETGRSIHDAFALRPHLFPSMVNRMIKVGEGTGKLDDILKKLATYYEDKVDDLLTNLSTIIEPVLLLVVGVAVGFIAVSIIGPIYDIANSI